MDITKLEIEKDNVVVKIKGTKPDEVIGCQYIVYVKKRVYDPDLIGNLRECVELSGVHSQLLLFVTFVFLLPLSCPESD